MQELSNRTGQVRDLAVEWLVFSFAWDSELRTQGVLCFFHVLCSLLPDAVQPCPVLFHFMWRPKPALVSFMVNAEWLME